MIFLCNRSVFAQLWKNFEILKKSILWRNMAVYASQNVPQNYVAHIAICAIESGQNFVAHMAVWRIWLYAPQKFDNYVAHMHMRHRIKNLVATI
jgi:hypothetical protein